MKSMVSLQDELYLVKKTRIWLPSFRMFLFLEGFEYVLRQGEQGGFPQRVYLPYIPQAHRGSQTSSRYLIVHLLNIVLSQIDTLTFDQGLFLVLYVLNILA